MSPTPKKQHRECVEQAIAFGRTPDWMIEHLDATDPEIDEAMRWIDACHEEDERGLPPVPCGTVPGYNRHRLLGEPACLRCRLVLEELFLNTVKHGHKGGSDAPIWITLSTRAGEIAIAYEDHAPPLNPFPLDRDAIVKKIEQERTEGGLGVILMHDLAASAQYAYLFGRNRIQLTVEKEA